MEQKQVQTQSVESEPSQGQEEKKTVEFIFTSEEDESATEVRTITVNDGTVIDKWKIVSQATENSLGGIKAAEKTSDDNQEVHIETSTGKLFTRSSGITYEEVQ